MTEPTDPKNAADPNTSPAQPPQPTQQIAHAIPDVKVSSTLEDMASWMANVRDPGLVNPDVPFALMPQMMKVVDFESHMPHPRMVRKRIDFIDAPSFLHYFNLFKLSYKPRMFCRMQGEGMTMLCVLDYDGPGNVLVEPTKDAPGQITKPQPMWNTHTSTLAMAYHPDYAALRRLDSQWMEQEDFAMFIEENTHLFKNPDGATMLELAQSLKGIRNANWQSGKRLANGETKLEYIETLEARAVRLDLVVPEYLELNSPIFDGYEAQDYRAAFRWRMVEGGKIKFSYRLLTKLVERKAVEDVKLDLVKQTGLPLYNVSTFEGIVKGTSFDD